MEVVVKMEGTKPTGSSGEADKDTETLMLGRFTMVCRDSKTQKARKVPRLIVETAEESTLWDIGEGTLRSR
jgi:acyl-coenzyme A thioesterase 9